MSLLGHYEGGQKHCKKREFLQFCSGILFLVLVATRAGAVVEDVEVGSLLVAQVPLVAVTGAAWVRREQLAKGSSLGMELFVRKCFDRCILVFSCEGRERDPSPRSATRAGPGSATVQRQKLMFMI